MSNPDIHTNKHSELISIYKYHNDLYITLYQLKTENEEELNSIYKMIKTEFINSKKYNPQNFIRDILRIIPSNDRYTKSYLTLARLISEDYHITEVNFIPTISNYMFYKVYGIKLDKSDDFNEIQTTDLDILSENTIYGTIMYDDKERFISFIERDGFDKDQKLKNYLYPYTKKGYSLLELCSYYGAVNCFKLLRTKFKSEITQTCLNFSFLRGNPEIMSECLKYQKPKEECIEFAIISHNIDFVTFLMNEYNIEINILFCGLFNNLDAFLVYFDKTNDVNKCFVYSPFHNVPSLCEYFILQGANINEKGDCGNTALHYATFINSKEIAELLRSHGAKE